MILWGGGTFFPRTSKGGGGLAITAFSGFSKACKISLKGVDSGTW